MAGWNVQNLPNHLSLQASIAEISSLRHTPAGIAAINLVLQHCSEMASDPALATEALLAGLAGNANKSSKPRQVNLVIKAVAFGKLAEQAAALPLLAAAAAVDPGGEAQSALACYQFSGFLTNVRGGKSIVLQLQSIQSLPFIRPSTSCDFV